MRISVVILTHNSGKVISQTVRSALKISRDVHIVDDLSTDSTLDILSLFPVNVVQHPFQSYGKQRNWAMDNLQLTNEWELHLDADEYLSHELIQEIEDLRDVDPSDVVGYCVPRLVRFMGRDIKHGGMYPIWHLRLFRRGAGRCEEREYDQHFYVRGKVRKLHSPLIDDMHSSIAEFVASHNRWSDAEVREQLGHFGGAERIEGRLLGGPIKRKRLLRRVYDGAPLFSRSLLIFVYRYVFRLGFLDGKQGLIFFVLQTFWFRFLIDAKLYEVRLDAVDKNRAS